MAEPLQVLLTSLLAIALSALFVHFAAKLVMGGSRFLEALLAVVVGGVLAGLVQLGVQALEWRAAVEILLVLAAYALGLALVYRASWLKGALLGVVAWVLWAVARYIVRLLPL